MNKLFGASILLALTALMLLFSRGVRAEQVTLHWSHPTTKMNGSPLTPAEITGTYIEYGNCNGAVIDVVMGIRSLEGVGTRAIVKGLVPGEWCFRVYTVMGAVKSDASNTMKKVIPVGGCTPGCHG